VNKPETIADSKEVLEYLTARMRTENGAGGMKAAELLARGYGLLSEGGATPAEIPQIIDDIMPAEEMEGGVPDG